MNFFIRPRLHWVRIRLYRAEFRTAAPETTLLWKDMPTAHYLRWEWYFRYRAAKLQVEHPRCFVELSTGSQEIELSEQEMAAKMLENKIRYTKSIVTKLKNRLDRYVKDYNSIWPIYQDVVYQKLDIAYRTRAAELDKMLKTN